MNAFINATAVERVRKGAAFLDVYWAGWWQEVDVATLDLSSSCRCVLGQLGVDYYYAADHFNCPVTPDDAVIDGFNLFEYFIFPSLGLDYESMQEMGFDSDDEAGVAYSDLQLAWQDVITQRRLAASIA